jgi:hypothetical protein
LKGLSGYFWDIAIAIKTAVSSPNFFIKLEPSNVIEFYKNNDSLESFKRF